MLRYMRKPMELMLDMRRARYQDCVKEAEATGVVIADHAEGLIVIELIQEGMHGRGRRRHCERRNTFIAIIVARSAVSCSFSFDFSYERSRVSGSPTQLAS